jgi:hypothetical protein
MNYPPSGAYFCSFLASLFCLTIYFRSNILRSSARLRNIITAPEFVTNFGSAKPHPQGKRQNIFGGEDELKVAPKGIDKEHK